MSISKTSFTLHLAETRLHQAAQKPFQQREHVSFPHKATSKTTDSSTKQVTDIDHSERKDREEDALYNKDSFSNIHKSHHDKDSTAQFYATEKSEPKSAEGKEAVSENKLQDDESKKVGGGEEENRQDAESHHRMSTPEALLSSAGQAISRMAFQAVSKTTSNAPDLEVSSSAGAIESTTAAQSTQSAQPSFLSQNVDLDVGEPLQKLSTSFSSQADPIEEEASTTKPEENPSLGAALSMGSRTNSMEADAKGNALEGAAPILPQDRAHLPGAEAKRAAQFLDELKANVTRFIASNEGKMTFNLKNVGGNLEGTAHASLEVIPHPFHIAVQFNTDHAGILKFLNDQKGALQTLLTNSYPGQVFDIKNQLTSQPSSQHFGQNGDRSKEDIASFDQENRGRRGSQNEQS